MFGEIIYPIPAIGSFLGAVDAPISIIKYFYLLLILNVSRYLLNPNKQTNDKKFMFVI